MPSKFLLCGAIALIFSTSAVAAQPATAKPATAKPVDGACALLTQAQIGSALGAQVDPGSAPESVIKKTCTWALPDGSEYVTLLLENQDQFEAAKTAVERVKTVTLKPVSGLGDDAYYLIVSKNTGLAVKKGDAAFRVAVYGLLSLDQKQAIEKTLAEHILPNL